MNFVDLSEMILTTKNANLKGLVLYGRIGEPLPTLPAMVTESKSLYVTSELKAFLFDLFAVQFSAEKSAECYLCNGRAVLLMPADQQPYSTIAVKGNIHLNLRPSHTVSLESNMPLICVYRKRNPDGFEILPASHANYSEMSIPDIPYFQKNLFYARKLCQEHISANELGALCPVCQKSAVAIPNIYLRESNGRVTRNACLPISFHIDAKINPDVIPARNFWHTEVSLQRALKLIPEDEYLLKAANLQVYSRGTTEPSPIILELYQKIADCNVRISRQLKNILAQPEDDFKETVGTLLSHISNTFTANWYNVKFGLKQNQTAKDFLEAVLQNMFDNAEQALPANIIDSVPQDKLLDFLTGTSSTENKVLKALAGALPSSVSYCFLLSVINTALNLKFSYRTLFNKSVPGIKIIQLVLTNPYALTFINPSLSINTLDKLACFVDKASDLTDLRIIAAVHNQMLNLPSGGTVIKKSSFYPRLEYKITGSVADIFADTHSILSSKQIELSRRLISKSNSCCVPAQAVLANSSVRISGLDVQKILDTYLNSGFGILLSGTYLVDYVSADEFCYIYNRLFNNADFLLSNADYSKLRADYEQSTGMKLTELQYKSAFLLASSASCLTGSAGSGKTTALDWILYVAENEYGYSEDDIALIAPSGMAAQRLSICTGRKANTIHSRLRIMTEEYLWSYDLKPDEDFGAKLVIIDESTMVSLGLMYNALKKIPNDVKILFCGDIEQLPAVESGKPFVDLINYLPYIRLSELKRAGADTGIAQNCSRMVNTRDEILKPADDFKLVSCDTSAVSRVLSSIVRYHLGLSDSCLVQTIENQRIFDKKDIQIISPVTKEKYTWGTAVLNPILQDIFNPVENQAVLKYFNRQSAEYRVDDRILNKRNLNGFNAYIWSDDAHTNLVRTTVNLCNGSIGYVKYIGLADDLSFFKNSPDDTLIPDYEMQEHTAPTKTGLSKVIMLVEYSSYDQPAFLVPYIAILNSKKGVLFDVQLTADFDYIELAYALTVHKMQGSQAKLIIAPVFGLPVYKNTMPFINKNMLYTMISRAQTGIYLLGDVIQGYSNPLMLARQNEAFSERKSIVDIALRRF